MIELKFRMEHSLSSLLPKAFKWAMFFFLKKNDVLKVIILTWYV